MISFLYQFKQTIAVHYARKYRAMTETVDKYQKLRHRYLTFLKSIVSFKEQLMTWILIYTSDKKIIKSTEKKVITCANAIIPSSNDFGLIGGMK